ncbi:bifunctional DNA primase/polymerase [Kitasatospora sp. RB6PN24]|nr:bifunctional DNA primase/polymerase [Kitasatospora humi]
MARWCARLGWPVHPLAAGRKTPAGNCPACKDEAHTSADCQCPARGRWCHGFHAATLDPALIDAWWGSRPDFGVGVSCGPAGLVVIDVDAHPKPVPVRARLLPGITIADTVNLEGLANGFHTLALLAALRGAPDPALDEQTLRVRTPSGGLHIWYRSPGTGWLSSAGSSTGRALAWQVDIRAHGGYIVAPGTITDTGIYQPVGACRTPAPLPQWLAAELARTGHLPSSQPPAPTPAVPSRARQAVLAAGGTDRPAERALATVLAAVADCGRVPQGAAFTDTLNRAAFTVGGLVAGGYLDADQARQRLLETAVHARPGQVRRCEQIIRAGMSAGLARPLHPGGRR